MDTNVWGNGNIYIENDRVIITVMDPHELLECTLIKASFPTTPVVQISISLLMPVPVWEACHLFLLCLALSAS